jgi:RNA polymerase sigma factor (sigma-70 family)
MRCNEPEEGFDEAYRRLWAPMVRLGHLLTGSVAVGEDLAQDAFVGMHRNWASVDNPDGYVRVALVNRVRNHARRAGRSDLRWSVAEASTGIAEIDETWELLRSLNERQRAAIVLRYYLDLPLQQIADLLGCRIGTVKSAIHRGLAQLKGDPALKEPHDER